MIRVKDAEKSLRYYQDVLGMKLVRTHEAPGAGFNLYFLAYPSVQPLPTDGQTSQREGLLELTWNYGTEKDDGFRYHNGNAEPQGFGHICILPRTPTPRPFSLGRGSCACRVLTVIWRQASAWMTSTPRASGSRTSRSTGRRG